MSNKNKVAIIFTGGTISMKIDPRIHTAIPALSSEDIISMVTNIEDFSDIEVINYANIPSPHITPTMMMEIAGLSFLGLGAQPPTAEWGSMMSAGRSMLQTYPWVVLSPGLAIFLSVVLFNLLGDTVRDVMDTRKR